MLNLSKSKIENYVDNYPLYSMKLVNTPKSTRLIIRWISWIMLGLFLCLFLPWQQNINSKGVITALNPKDRPQSIPTIIPGRIDRWYVNEGQFVKKGDTVVVITEVKEKYFDPQLLVRTESQIKSKESSILAKRAKVEALNRQFAALQAARDFSVNKAKNKYAQVRLKVISDSNDVISEQVDMQIAARQWEAQQKLYEKGLKSLTELETRKAKFQEQQAKLVSVQNKLEISRSEYINAKIELSSLAAEYADKLAKCTSDINNTQSEIFDAEVSVVKMRNDLSNLQIRSGFYAIKAPQDGYILKASQQGLGETLKEGDVVFTIMPNVKQLAVELYVKPMDMPLLYVGCPMRVQFDGWPALVFSGWPSVSVGTFGGKVANIDRVTSQYNKFRVLVIPDDEDHPWPDQLHIGAGASGWAMLNNVMVWYEIWRQFNGFPPDYTQDLPSDYNYIYNQKAKDKAPKPKDDAEKE